MATPFGRSLANILRISRYSQRRFNVLPTLAKQYSTSSVPETSSDNDLKLTLTDNCVKQIHKITDSKESHLRVLVESGGCSGFQYKFELDSQVNGDDRVFEKEGAKIIIDSDSLRLIGGSVVDFQSELIRSAFCITENPKAEHGCSCGASFSVKI